MLQRFLHHLSEPHRLPGLVWKNIVYPFTPEAAGRRWDRSLQIETALEVGAHELDAVGEHAGLSNGYVPTPALIAEHLIDKVVDRANGFTFFDFGAGKGRVVLLAARRPFRRVIGLEHSPELVKIAQENIASFANAGGLAPMEIILADVAEYTLPPVPSVLFFYNPFKASLTTEVVKRIEASLLDHPRKLFVIFYETSDHEHVFERHLTTPRFRREDVKDLPKAPDDRYGFPAAIFEST